MFINRGEEFFDFEGGPKGIGFGSQVSSETFNVCKFLQVFLLDGIADPEFNGGFFLVQQFGV